MKLTLILEFSVIFRALIYTAYASTFENAIIKFRQLKIIICN